MVEASIVLPILILTILSLILLLIYYFSCLTTQIDVHENLIVQPVKEETLIRTLRKEKGTSTKIGGVISIFMNHNSEGNYYQINEPLIIRLGESIKDDK